MFSGSPRGGPSRWAKTTLRANTLCFTMVFAKVRRRALWKGGREEGKPSPTQRFCYTRPRVGGFSIARFVLTPQNKYAAQDATSRNNPRAGRVPRLVNP